MRGEPQHFLYSKVMCWVALDRAIVLADRLHAEDRVEDWSRARAEIAEAVLDQGWSDDAQGVHPVLRLHRPRRVQPHAADRRVPARRRPPDASPPSTRSPSGSPTSAGWSTATARRTGVDGLAGEEGTFLLCTFWLAQALALAGQVDRAREVFDRAAGYVTDLGLLAEEVDAGTGELLGNFPQAFSHIGLVNAAWAIHQAEHRATAATGSQRCTWRGAHPHHGLTEWRCGGPMDADPGADRTRRRTWRHAMQDTGPTTTAVRRRAAPRWIAARVAHPVHDLDRSAAFYRDLLGLQPRGGFTDHEGFSGAFFALPGGCELELTTGPGDVLPSSGDDLVVLYVASLQDAQRRAEALLSAGAPTVPSANPYWDRWGRTFLDPDGYAVVVAAADATGAAQDVAPAEVRVQPYTGERERLRGLFGLAEDSPTELDAYLHTGRVLAALSGGQVVGHLQLVDTGRPGQVELKNMAVRETLQGHGIGGRRVIAAVTAVAASGGTKLLVATAAADIGNLRFYQRQGFRMRAIERDVFTPAAGYPPGLATDGIAVRDRVWLDRSIEHADG